MIELLPNDVKLLLIYMVFSAAVQALPDLDDTSPKWYVFLYRFLHTLAMNFGLVRKTYRINNGKLIE